MKKRKLVLAVLATLTIGLTGCTPSDNPDTPVDPDDPVVENYFIQEPTTITLWSTIGDNNQPYIEQYIESFKEIEPNVTIENVQQSGSYDDLAKMVVTGFAANNYPDLIQAYPDAVSDFLSYDKVVNLDSYIDNEDYGWTADEKADYVQAYLDEGANYSIEGTYSMPFSKSTECMFYNEDILLYIFIQRSCTSMRQPCHPYKIFRIRLVFRNPKRHPILIKTHGNIKRIYRPNLSTE